jgi:DNA polymerase elongation subunit (family B)
MLELGDGLTISEALAESMQLVEVINQSYDQFARERLNAEENRFQIEFEKLYRRFFQGGKKKRYAGHIVWKEGVQVDKVDITGFEYVRSDIPSIVREVQGNVLEMAVKDTPEDEIRDYIRDVHEQYINGEFSLEEVGRPSGIGKPLDEYKTESVHVVGAKVANALLGTNFGGGSKPKRVILSSYPNDLIEEARENGGLNNMEEKAVRSLENRFRPTNSKDPAICFDRADQVPDGLEIDWEEMLESTLRGPIERVIEPLGIGWDETVANQKQMGLNQW